jgi:hypothetical protein
VWGATGSFRRFQHLNRRDKVRATKQTLDSWAKAEHKVWARATPDCPRSTALDWGTAHTREWWALSTSHLCQEGGNALAETDRVKKLTELMGRDLIMVKSEMRKLERQETTWEVKMAIKKNDDLAAEGRMKTVICKLIDKSNRSSVIDVLKTLFGPLTDPEEMHEYIKGERDQIFSHPKDSLPYYLGLKAPPQAGNPPAIWEGFLTNSKNMVKRFHEDRRVQIPEAMIWIIAMAFNGENAGRDTAEAEIAAAMARPYTGADIRREIQRQKNTSPGLSGLMYRCSRCWRA